MGLERPSWVIWGGSLCLGGPSWVTGGGIVGSGGTWLSPGGLEGCGRVIWGGVTGDPVGSQGVLVDPVESLGGGSLDLGGPS